jgi:hypothetical protein
MDSAAASSLGLGDLLASRADISADEMPADVNTFETNECTASVHAQQQPQGGGGTQGGTHGADSQQQQRQPAWRTSAGVPMLEAVLRETLRLHPVAPLVVRRLTSDAVATTPTAGSAPSQYQGANGDVGGGSVVGGGGGGGGISLDGGTSGGLPLDRGRQTDTMRPISDGGGGVGGLSLDGGRQLSGARPISGSGGGRETLSGEDNTHVSRSGGVKNDARTTVVLPAGCAVGVWLHAVHRDSTVWSQPDDFLPERWLISPEEWAREQALPRSLSEDGVSGGLADKAAAVGTEAPHWSVDDSSALSSQSPEASVRAKAEGAGAATASAGRKMGRQGGIDGSGGDGSSGSRMRVRFKGAAFMPFAAGPRSCVGQHLAWVFMRLVLARIVCRYTIMPAPAPAPASAARGKEEGKGGSGGIGNAAGDVNADPDPFAPSVGFTVTPANAARIMLTPRYNLNPKP